LKIREFDVILMITKKIISVVEIQCSILQRLACLYITGATRTAPNTAIEIITGIVPLAVYIKREAMAACFRLKLNSQWVQTTGDHTKIKQVLATNVPLYQQQIYHIAPKFVFDKNFTTFVPDRNDWKYNGVILNDDVVCYNDGSRIERTGVAGAGVYVHTDGKAKNLFFPSVITPQSSRLKSLPC